MLDTELREELLLLPAVDLLLNTTWVQSSHISKEIEEAIRSTAVKRHEFLCSPGCSLQGYLDLFPFLKSSDKIKSVVSV